MEVAGSNPAVPTNSMILKGGSSSVAERQLPKLNVAGSIPVSRSNIFSKIRKPIRLCALFVLRSHHEHGLFKFVEGR